MLCHFRSSHNILCTTCLLLILFSFQEKSSLRFCHAEKTNITPKVEPPSPPSDFQCPPGDVVSSSEELDHYCVYGEWFATTTTYACYDWKANLLCEGNIDPTMNLPTCHTPSISDCSNHEEYFSVCTKEKLAFDPNKMNCDSIAATFACWDKVENRWCQGTVKNPATTATTATTGAGIAKISSPTTSGTTTSSSSSSSSSTTRLCVAGLLGAFVITAIYRGGGRQRRHILVNDEDQYGSIQYVELESTTSVIPVV